MTQQQDVPGPQQFMLGSALAVVGVLAAVGTALFVSRDPIVLWGLVLILFMVDEVKDAKTYRLHPVYTGGVMLIGSLLIAVAEWYFTLPYIFWALFLVVFFADDLTEVRS